MTTERPLRPGDEVEVRIPGVVSLDGTIFNLNGNRLWASARHVAADGGEVVVTLPVDHPSRDPVGTVRGDATEIWVKVNRYDDAAENFDPPHDDYTGVWWNIMCTGEEERTGDAVEEFPVIGVVPGSPAAEVHT